MIQQSKINGFIKSITDVAEQKRARIDAETDDILASEKKQLELAAKKAAEEYYRVKSAGVKLAAGRRISESSADYRKKVFERRNEIERTVFSGVEKRLAEFTESEKYKEFLLESARRITAEFDGGTVTFLLRPEDMKYAELLCGEIDGARVQEDSSVRIGGLRARSGSKPMLVDDTLDGRLKQQTRFFEENSGLYISMGQ